jgi:hypothetical protein
MSPQPAGNVYALSDTSGAEGVYKYDINANQLWYSPLPVSGTSTDGYTGFMLTDDETAVIVAGFNGLSVISSSTGMLTSGRRAVVCTLRYAQRCHSISLTCFHLCAGGKLIADVNYANGCQAPASAWQVRYDSATYFRV